jgi:hypothetical protein
VVFTVAALTFEELATLARTAPAVRAGRLVVDPQLENPEPETLNPQHCRCLYDRGDCMQTNRDTKTGAPIIKTGRPGTGWTDAYFLIAAHRARQAAHRHPPMRALTDPLSDSAFDAIGAIAHTFNGTRLDKGSDLLEAALPGPDNFRRRDAIDCAYNAESVDYIIAAYLFGYAMGQRARD